MKHDTTGTSWSTTPPRSASVSLRDQLLDLDRDYFARRRTGTAPEVVGIDVSLPAISYAVESGFLDDGAQDLERDDPSPELSGMLESVDPVTITGGIGHITEYTIGRVLDAAPTTPRLARSAFAGSTSTCRGSVRSMPWPRRSRQHQGEETDSDDPAGQRRRRSDRQVDRAGNNVGYPELVFFHSRTRGCGSVP